MTESYAALQTLQHFFEVNYQNTATHNIEDSPETSCSDAKSEQLPPMILFGSSFPRDKHFTQVLKKNFWLCIRRHEVYVNKFTMYMESYAGVQIYQHH